MTPETLAAIQTLSGVGATGLLIWFIFIIKKDAEKKDEIMKEQRDHIKELNGKFEQIVVENTKAITASTAQSANVEKAVDNNTRAIETFSSRFNDMINK